MVWQKAPLRLKRHQAAKKIKPVALAIVERAEKNQARSLSHC